MLLFARVSKPSSEWNSSRLESLTLTWPTHNGAVVQLVRPTVTLRNHMMRLPTTLTLHSATSQTKRDTASNSMLMTSQSTLTTCHRSHPCLAQNFRRENQLASQDSSARLSDLSFFDQELGAPRTQNPMMLFRATVLLSLHHH